MSTPQIAKIFMLAKLASHSLSFVFQLSLVSKGLHLPSLVGGALVPSTKPRQVVKNKESMALI